MSGRAARVVDAATGERRIGRFGWKAQHATLLTFGADAYRNEMGITNDVFSAEVAFGVTAERMRACDRIGDPEDIRDPVTRRRGIDNFASFMRFLGPVAREGSSELTRAGEQVFAAIGCATCHHPVLNTGPSSNPLFDRKPVALFSDLLLHDVGTGDGIVQGPAEEEEIRTPALWGLRLRRPLLHDGSAATTERRGAPAWRRGRARAPRVRAAVRRRPRRAAGVSQIVLTVVEPPRRRPPTNDSISRTRVATSLTIVSPSMGALSTLSKP